MERDLFKCVGGSIHGKRVRCAGREYRVAICPGQAGWSAPSDAESWDTLRYQTYVQHRVGFGNHTFITVLRLEGMGEDEFFRRITDLVEL